MLLVQHGAVDIFDTSSVKAAGAATRRHDLRMSVAYDSCVEPQAKSRVLL